MQTNRWKLVAFTAVAGVLLAACEDIIVEVLDRTAPELGLAYSGRPPARFADTGADVTIDNPVMSGRAFIVNPTRANDSMVFIPVARDGQSAIRSQDATVEFTLTCTARIFGGNVTKEVRAYFSGNQFSPDVDGETTKDTEGFTISMTTTDLWKRGGCERWGQVIDVHDGWVSNIRGVVRARASNNAQPVLSSTFEAPFTNPSAYTISY